MSDVMTFQSGRWVTVPAGPAEARTRFVDIWHYYANLIDYFRVLLCVAASFTLAGGYPGWTAALIMASVLLDWIDGPVARAYGQCTVFGSGADWLADILAEVMMLAFWASYGISGLPLIMIATSIEVATAIFDYGTQTTTRYPVFERRGGFLTVLNWAMPGGRYTWFGTAIWLLYPVFVLAICLDVAWVERAPLTAQVLRAFEYALALPAFLYIWCEAAWLVSIIDFWNEAPRKSAEPTPASGQATPTASVAPPGCELVGSIPESDHALLRTVHEATLEKLGAQWESSLARKEVFWVNLWQATGGEPPLAVDRVGEVDSWARALVAKHYAGLEVELNGYGLITNPIGSKTQPWHLDYNDEFSTLYVPLTALTPNNCFQYLMVPPNISRETYARAIADPDRVDFDWLVAHAEWVSVCQLIAKPFSVVKSGFGTVHRGITNTGDFHRVLFWVSVKKHGPPLPLEPLVEVIHKT